MLGYDGLEGFQGGFHTAVLCLIQRAGKVEGDDSREDGKHRDNNKYLNKGECFFHSNHLKPVYPPRRFLPLGGSRACIFVFPGYTFHYCCTGARLRLQSMKVFVDVFESFVGDMGIYLSSGDIGMPEQFLYGAQVGTVFK